MNAHICTSKTGEESLLEVLIALDYVIDRAVNIGEALRVEAAAIKKTKNTHKNNRSLVGIGILSAWLRGQHGKKGTPYSLHTEDEHKCPSWWNLVYVVAETTGGNNYAHAGKIAKEGIIILFMMGVRIKQKLVLNTLHRI